MSGIAECGYPVPEDEEARLFALAAYRAGGTAPEPRFDEIARLAAEMFEAPIAFVSLVERERQWLKARIGLDHVEETPRCVSFCTHTIMGDAVFVVPDALADERFAAIPLVQDDPNVRFYAGAPLVTGTGHRIGSLCILDTRPRPPLTAKQEQLLSHFAKLVMTQLELRREGFVSRTMKAFAESTDLALMSTDENGTVLFVNRAAETLFGYAPEEIVGQSLNIIVPERFRDLHEAGFARLRSGAPSTLSGKTIELPALRRDGTEIPIEYSLSVWRGNAGFGVGAIMRDISERRQRDARLLRLAQQDPLTGLANRARLDERLAELIAAGRAVGVLMFDLDGFKVINDSLGHVVGDTLLQILAVRLLAALDAGALLARCAGDEFVVVLPDAVDVERMETCAAAILSALRTPFDVLGHSLIVGASIGGTLGPAHGTDGDELIASADLALHHARTDGGRRFRLFEPSMRDAVAEERALQVELRRAIDAAEFRLHYQPQVSLRTGAIVGAEALLRWEHPERGLLMPGAFLHGIEAGSLALHVGWWTLDEACRQAAEWRAAGLPPIRIGVNLFTAQFRAGTLVESVTEALGRHGLPPAALELEVTETIALQHDDSVLEPLRALHRLGVAIAFDDFGTGYASLSTLKRFPLTTLKIDRSFVKDLLRDEHDAAIVSAVLTMGRGLGLAVIAEGIETAEQEAALKAMGCSLGQGYRYGRAVPPAAFAEGLARVQTRLAG